MAIKTQTVRVNEIPGVNMPEFVSRPDQDHDRVVHAIKIVKLEPYDFEKEVETDVDTVGEVEAFHIKVDDPDIFSFTMGKFWVLRENAQVGDYFVRFDDGNYGCFPPDVFESQYVIAEGGE